ncbi:MAG: IS630 family transposase [Flavisolibacter sp.]|nr:IS630 family transposase [Flavisolibacter sp.]
MAGVKKHPDRNIPRQQKQKKKQQPLKKVPAFFYSSHTATKPLKVFFEDEARFGRINNVSRCWVPKGKRAAAGKQMIREHTYAFSAVCPSEGESYSLISPVCNTAAINELLRGLSVAYCDEEILLFADSAGWHQSKELQRSTNIHLELLPPYSPELNAAEHLWDYIREQKGFTNHVFDSMDEWKNHVEEVRRNLHQEKDFIQSLCSFHWMIYPP